MAVYFEQVILTLSKSRNASYFAYFEQDKNLP